MAEINNFASLFRYFSGLKEYEVNMTFEQFEKMPVEKMCNSESTHTYWYVAYSKYYSLIVATLFFYDTDILFVLS